MDVFKGSQVSAGIVAENAQGQCVTIKLEDLIRNVVGIDVSSRSSMVTILQKTPIRDEVLRVGKPFCIDHTSEGLNQVIEKVKALPGTTKILMEHTGRYYESLANLLSRAGLFVSCLNPLVFKEDGNGEVHKSKVKTDKADSQKIAEYGIKYYSKLPEYSRFDDIRYEARLVNRELQFASKRRTASSNHLVALLEETYPGVRDLFTSPPRKDGHQKWIDFVKVFWHVDCVRKLSMDEFTERYRAFCKENKYNFSKKKAEEVYLYSQYLIANATMSDSMKLLFDVAVEQLQTDSTAKEKLANELRKLTSQLPEYSTVMDMAGVGDTLGAQLIAEIGDIRRFKSKNSLASYAGIDPGKKDSGKKMTRSNKTSKRGSPHLRRSLFLVCDALIKAKPDDPVYQYLDKKRKEGKKYYVYMVAGANKFLRMYYGKVRDALKVKGLWDVGNADDGPEHLSDKTI